MWQKAQLPGLGRASFTFMCVGSQIDVFSHGTNPIGKFSWGRRLQADFEVSRSRFTICFSLLPGSLQYHDGSCHGKEPSPNQDSSGLPLALERFSSYLIHVYLHRHLDQPLQAGLGTALDKTGVSRITWHSRQTDQLPESSLKKFAEHAAFHRQEQSYCTWVHFIFPPWTRTSRYLVKMG